MEIKYDIMVNEELARHGGFFRPEDEGYDDFNIKLQISFKHDKECRKTWSKINDFLFLVDSCSRHIIEKG